MQLRGNVARLMYIETRFKVVSMKPEVLVLFLALCYASGVSANKMGQADDHMAHQHNANAFLDSEDKDEVKELNPSEQKTKMREIVKRIDTDSDKYLNSEEITKWIQKVYRRYAMDDAKERFPEFDSNVDGLVTWDEYNLKIHGPTIKLDEISVFEDPEEESLRFLYLKEKRRFDSADVDGTPGLNLTEFLAFTHPADVDYMADFAIEDVLNKYDLDNDGFITLSEFIGDLGKNGDKPSQWEIEETVRFKDIYDQDKDGKLNREEQLLWVAPNNYGSACEEAVHLIREMDQDADQKLSEAEILHSLDTFMNSELTDYGRQFYELHDEL